MFKITIPKPCFEDWENMTPDGLGRYCNGCAKTVVDFSVMSDEAVQQYIINNYGQKMCGRFKTTQVQRIVIDLPQNIFHAQLPFWKKFLIAFLIIYGSTFFSIDTTIAGTTYNASNTFHERLQGEPVIKKEKQKKKHKRRRSWAYAKCKEIKLDITNMISGGFGMHEEIHEPGWSVQPDPMKPDLFSFIKKSDTGNNKTSILSADNNKNKPAPSPPKPPIEKTVYILPAALALRNPFSKKKKA